MEKPYAILFAFMMMTVYLAGCTSAPKSGPSGPCYDVDDADLMVSWTAAAEQATASDTDVLLNIRMSDVCSSSLVFALNGTSGCEEGRRVGTCIESINVKLPSGGWEDCTPFADAPCTVTLNNGTIWEHDDLLIVEENGIDLFTDGDVIGDKNPQDWTIVLID